MLRFCITDKLVFIITGLGLYDADLFSLLTSESSLVLGYVGHGSKAVATTAVGTQGK